jgi:hypothetical protein
MGLASSRHPTPRNGSCVDVKWKVVSQLLRLCKASLQVECPSVVSCQIGSDLVDGDPSWKRLYSGSTIAPTCRSTPTSRQTLSSLHETCGGSRRSVKEDVRQAASLCVFDAVVVAVFKGDGPVYMCPGHLNADLAEDPTPCCTPHTRVLAAVCLKRYIVFSSLSSGAMCAVV